MDINYKAIGVRIKAARARKGVTQATSPISLSVHPHISNIETGNTKLGLPTLFIWLMYLMYRWMNFCAITLNAAKNLPE